MKKLTVRTWFGLALGLGAAALSNAQSAADPRAGVWEEQTTSTHYDSIRRLVENAPGGMTRMVLNAKLDEANRQHVDFRCDGKRYPILHADGRPTGKTYSCHRVGSRALDSVLASEGDAPGVETRVREAVSADGKTLTMSISARSAEGRLEESQRQFVRREP